MSNQLVRKNIDEGYRKVFPNTFIDAIKDRESGVPLTEVLQKFNMYFLTYNGSKKLTRCQVPLSLRHEGLWITYILFDHTIITEWYGSNKIDDTSWGMDSNWRVASNSLVGDISISSDGYWIVNGEKTSTKAQGDPPIFKVLEGSIMYSYNNINWYPVITLDKLIPDINVSETESIDAQAAPSVEKYGGEHSVEFKFKLPKAPDIAINSVDTGASGTFAKVENVGNEYHLKLNFTIPKGDMGVPGQKGDGWEVKGFVDSVAQLPTSGKVGDLYLVGTAEPYDAYVYKNDTNKFVNIGNTLEVKASIFDGGRADTKYGGARTIDCGGADAYLTY